MRLNNFKLFGETSEYAAYIPAVQVLGVSQGYLSTLWMQAIFLKSKELDPHS